MQARPPGSQARGPVRRGEAPTTLQPFSAKISVTHRDRLARVLGPRAIEPSDVPARTSDDDATAGGVAHVRSSRRRFAGYPSCADGGRRGGPEGVHQTRVAVRRFRSDLQTSARCWTRTGPRHSACRSRDAGKRVRRVRDPGALIDRLTGMGDQAGRGRVDGGQDRGPASRRQTSRPGASTPLLRAAGVSRLARPLVDGALQSEASRQRLQPSLRGSGTMVAKRWRKLRNAVRASTTRPPTSIRARSGSRPNGRARRRAVEPVAG